MRGTKLTALLTAALAIALVTPAFGAVAFTTFGPGDAFQGGGPIIDNNVYRARDFAAGVSGKLTSVRVAVAKQVAGGNFVVSLRAPGVDPNGAVLESWTVAPALIPSFPSFTIVTLPSVVNPTLTAGTVYWIRVEAAPGASYNWADNSAGFTGYTRTLNQGATWTTVSGQFDVTGTFDVNVAPFTFTKQFGAPNINQGSTTTLTFTISNNTPAAASVGFSDTLTAGIVAVGPTGGTCTGTVDGLGQIISLSGSTLAANSSCTLTVTVRGDVDGVYNNTATGTGSLEGINPSATLTVAAVPLLFTKQFAPTSIAVGSTTILTFTITNPRASSVAIGFSDTLAAGIVAVVPTNATCTGTVDGLGQIIGLSGSTLDANTSCTVSVTVRGDAVDIYNNTATGTDGLTGINPSASLTVVPALPTISKAFNPSTIAIAGTSVLSFTITNQNPTVMSAVAFSDTFPAGVIVSQSPNPTNTCGGTFVPVSNASSVSLTGGSIAANGSCTLSVTVQGTTPGTKVNTTGTVSGTVSATVLTGNTATATLEVTESQVSFLIRYAANLNIGESVVNFTNTGESSTFSFGGNLAQNGEICANVFAYSPDEQLVSCCSCNVTPNGLNSLSVKADLGTNTLTPIIPSSLVIKVVATQGGAACNAAAAATVNTAVLQPGLAAWGTSLHALPVAGGTTAGTFGVAETPFSRGTITPAELQRMAQLCSFIRANGSGYGICKSCKVGGLGASAK